MPISLRARLRTRADDHEQCVVLLVLAQRSVQRLASANDVLDAVVVEVCFLFRSLCGVACDKC
jgi:hypothetical protein